MTLGDAIVFIFLFCVVFVVAVILGLLGALLGNFANPDRDLLAWVLGIGGFCLPYGLIAIAMDN